MIVGVPADNRIGVSVLTNSFGEYEEANVLRTYIEYKLVSKVRLCSHVLVCCLTIVQSHRRLPTYGRSMVSPPSD
jgi:hypothetical protein